jgi:hypothetical protein
VNVQGVDVLPAASVAVQLTVVVPTGKVEPDAGAHATVAPAQLSSELAVKLTTVEHWPAVLFVTMLAGQLAVGGTLSTTVTVKLQLGPTPVVHVTVVMPTAKVEPDGGAHVTAPHVPPIVGGE